MKFIKMLAAVAFAVAVCASVAVAADKLEIKKGSCCDKAKTAGKACEHKCCVEATAKKEVCAKCNAPAKKDAK